ncbi:MAG: hypothetical protein AB7F21_08660 [Desulfuromonadales bacterium]
MAEVAGGRAASIEDFFRHMVGLRGHTPTKFLIVRGNRGYYI